MSKKIDGIIFQSMIEEGTLSLRDQMQHINALNVFPVPDGDTGTNMTLTMQSALEEVKKLYQPSLGQAAECTASALLRGARGNSGVILSLLFRGFARKLKDVTQADGCMFALALREGVETAYKAVMHPAEGTILTVSRVTTQMALEQCQTDGALSVEAVFKTLLTHGETALQQTQTQNPVLAKAQVVDAGAAGFLAILSGMQDAFLGTKREHQAVLETAPAADFSKISDADIRYTYCTEWIAQRLDKARNISRLRADLNQLGDSLVVVEDGDIVKVHVHTDEPHKVLEEGLKFGPLLTVKIENMRQQHTAKVISGTAPETEQRTVAAPEKTYGFTAIAAGAGLASVFTDLGVDKIVEGGQTMNPSTNDILCAADAVPAEIIYILPNNKNIQMAAEQAVPLSTKQLIVLPSQNIPQGMAAMLAFDPAADQAANTAAMTQALSTVTAGQLTFAARDSSFDGKKIKQGEFLALCEGKLCATGKKPFDVMKKLAHDIIQPESAFVTLLYGEGVSQEDAEKVAEVFRKENKNLEITVINGGQPVYYYIVSVE